MLLKMRTATLIFTCIAATFIFESINGQFVNNKCEATESSEEEFPDDVFTYEQRIHGAILVHVFIAVYCFITVMFICDDYFLPAIFCICTDLQITPDIAAATFMASATSFPEMSVNIIATFITNSDLGIGTIVGSSVCNTLGVAGIAGLAIRKSIKLEIWPLLRDSVIHICVLIVLTFILWDGVVEWTEALLLVSLYFVYLLVMIMQKHLLPYCSGECNYMQCCHTKKIHTRKYNIEEKKINAVCELVDNDWSKNIETKAISISSEDEQKVVTAIKKCWYWFTLPSKLILSLTVPDCKKYRKAYPVTFIMCVLWIGITTYVVCWMVTIFGETFGIPDAIMGMSFLALGGNVPEASSAFINARKGRGTMSMSNTLGANTLDILLSLGVPWLVKCSLSPLYGGGTIYLSTNGLPINCLGLIAGVLLLNSIAASTGYSMNRIFGVYCLLGYAAISIVFILVGLGVVSVFGITNC